MKLIDVYSANGARGKEFFLYQLLSERTPEQSISHKRMPAYEEHVTFVRSRPYEAWYVVEDGDMVGAIYLTKNREVGIFVIKEFQAHGYAQAAIAELRKRHPGPLLANVNPANTASQHLFEKLGGKIIQVTYAL